MSSDYEEDAWWEAGGCEWVEVALERMMRGGWRVDVSG